VHPDTVEAAIQWFIKQLSERYPTEDVQFRMVSKVLFNVRSLLKVSTYRLDFARETGLEVLGEISRYDAKKAHGRNVELIYSSLYCIWMLSFHPQVRKTMTVSPLFNNLCLLLRHCQEKDKVVRMCLAILRNLLNIQQNNRHMISFNLDRIIQNIKVRPSVMADRDVVDDIEAIEEALDKVKEELSSYDVYQSEVTAKNLEWSSPIHKSDKFWQENCYKIADSPVLSHLKEILDTEENYTVLCVACWDIGEFVRFHPQGKILVNQLQIKEPLVKLPSTRTQKCAAKLCSLYKRS